MFTGIVEAMADVLEGGGRKLTLKRPFTFSDLQIGSSVSVAGVCLTVASLDDRSMTFDLTEETLARTTLGGVRPGTHLNLERALKVSGRFEGHVVQGHIDSVGEVREIVGERFRIAYSPALRGLIVEKGSIAVDGVSLTIAAVDAETFTVALIPFTREHTTLGVLRPGSQVNLEADILGKYVRNVV